MRNIEYYRGRIAKVGGSPGATALIDRVEASTIPGDFGPLTDTVNSIWDKILGRRTGS